MTLPAHPLIYCPQARSGTSMVLCNFEWRIETLTGQVISKTIDRAPKDTERLVRRCTRCHKECP